MWQRAIAIAAFLAVWGAPLGLADSGRPTDASWGADLVLVALEARPGGPFQLPGLAPGPYWEIRLVVSNHGPDAVSSVNAHVFVDTSLGGEPQGMGVWGPGLDVGESVELVLSWQSFQYAGDVEVEAVVAGRDDPDPSNNEAHTVAHKLGRPVGLGVHVGGLQGYDGSTEFRECSAAPPLDYAHCFVIKWNGEEGSFCVSVRYKGVGYGSCH